MNFNFPIYWALLPLAVGLIYGFLFYTSSPFLSISLNRVLFCVRSLIVFIIGLLLLDPYSHWKNIKEEKPEILFLQDNSASILLNADKTYYLTNYGAHVKNLIKKLSKTYTVHTYSFGHGFRSDLPLNFQDKETDFSALQEVLKDRYEGRNIGAIILATDGLFNKGVFPMEGLQKFHSPVYCLGLGDTSQQKDALINQIEYNEVVFAGDRIPIKAFFSAQNLKGEKAELLLKSSSSILQKQIEMIKNNDFHGSVTFEINATDPGNYTYEVEIKNLAGEITPKNNSKRFNLVVLKSKQEILILTGISHPDLSALKQSLSLSRNNTVVVKQVTGQDFKEIEKYSCIILYQIPSSSGLVLSPYLEKKLAELPTLHIMGLQSTRFSLRNQEISPYNSGTNVSTQSNYINKSFRLFSYSDSLVNLISHFPPLEGPSVVMKNYDPEKVLMYSGGSESEKSPSPVFYFENNLGKKSATILGEGIWKWRALEFEKTGSHHIIDGMMQKTISYLTVQEDKSRLRILLPKIIWSEFEPIQMEAQWYNEAFELENRLPLHLNLSNEKGKVYHYVFVPNGNQYQINLGFLPIGTYNYRVEAEGINSKEWKNGILRVEPAAEEFSLTQADHSILYQISKETSGELILPSKMEDIYVKIQQNKGIKPLLNEMNGDLPWIQIPFILGGLIVLLSLEWGVRKWNGVY